MAIDTGLSAWRSKSNHNAMIGRQGDPLAAGEVRLTYFGGSAFQIETPGGLTLMIDPWRNLPSGSANWFYSDFPKTTVDIGLSTHAHYDHDALHRLDAHVLLDRLIGCYEMGDLRITGIPDKHATDVTYGPYDYHRVMDYFGASERRPPDNSRSWDNCIQVVETGGLRIVHWGDNRHNPPEDVWEALGRVDILLLPIDDSQHVLGFPLVDEITARLRPKVLIPHHYSIWNIVMLQSTLKEVDSWIAAQNNVRDVGKASAVYAPGSMPEATRIDHFGDHVGFDVDQWHRDNGRDVRPEV